MKSSVKIIYKGLNIYNCLDITYNYLNNNKRAVLLLVMITYTKSFVMNANSTIKNTVITKTGAYDDAIEKLPHNLHSGVSTRCDTSMR